MNSKKWPNLPEFNLYCIPYAFNIFPFQFELAADHGLRVDDHMRTSEQDVYAAGDVCTAGWEPSTLWQQVKLRFTYCISVFHLILLIFL